MIANKDFRAISAGQLSPGGRGGTSAPENELDDRGSRPHNKKKSITVGRDGEPPIQRDSKRQPTARPRGSRPVAFPVGNDRSTPMENWESITAQVVGSIAGGSIPVQMMHPEFIEQVPRLRIRRKGPSPPAPMSTSCAPVETANS